MSRTTETPTRTIETEAALSKLARVLEVEQTEVNFLDHLPLDALRDLRWEISDRLNAADAARLAGVMAASRLVPIGLAASIGEKWFGPVLCARLVGLVDSRRGGQYASHLSVAFMADITARTDPRVVGDLVHELDIHTMQKIALTLLRRGDYLTLSHFVGHVPSQVVAAILEAIDDNAAVVRIARYVEDLSQLDPVVALLPDDRILDLVCAVEAADLWIEGLYLFGSLGDNQITRIATTIVGQDTKAVIAALDAFTRHGLWDQGIRLVDHLAPSDIAVLADVLLVLDDTVVDSVVDAIDRISAWSALVRIAVGVNGLSEAVRARLRVVVQRLSHHQIACLEDAAVDCGHPELLAELIGSPTTH
jgi:hypothetical protein